MTKQIQNALDRAVDMQQRDGLTMDQCLAKFPESQSLELRPLLKTISLIQKQADSIPESVAKLKNKTNFMALLDETRAQSALTLKNRLHTYRQRLSLRLRQIMVTGIALLLISSSIATAAMRSGPTSPLYPLKRALETVQLVLPRSNYGKAKTSLSLAKERLKEMAMVKGKKSVLGELDNNLNLNLKRAKELIEQGRLTKYQRQEILKDYEEIKERRDNFRRSWKKNSKDEKDELDENKQSHPSLKQQIPDQAPEKVLEGPAPPQNEPPIEKEKLEQKIPQEDLEEQFLEDEDESDEQSYEENKEDLANGNKEDPDNDD